MGTRVMTDLSYSVRPSSDLQGKSRDDNVRTRRDIEFGMEPPLSQRRNELGDLAGTLSQTPGPSHSDQLQRLAGLSIGFCSMFTEQLMSHPCIVLRRQCQVHHSGSWYHLTPLSVLQTVINIQRSQGGLVLWKGLGGVYVVRGISMVSESLISEVTTFPREVSRHSSIKKLGGHLILKSIVFAVTTPFYAASLIETIQSEIASERPGVLDVVFEGMSRIKSWGAPQTSRLIPLWHLALPTVVFRLCHYVVNSIAQFTVTSAMHLERQERIEQPGGDTSDVSVYETYFPDLLATFTGGLLADIITFPLETVLHRMYVQGTRTIIDNTDTGLGVIPITTRYEGFLDCFRSIINEEGLQGLYRGFGALIIQYAIHAMILRLAKFLFVKISKQLTKKSQVGVEGKAGPSSSASAPTNDQTFSYQSSFK